MEIVIIALVIVVIGATIFYWNQKNNGLDVNKDGQTDAKDAIVVAEAVAAKVEAATTKIKKQAKAGAAKVKIARAKKAKTKA